jgi:hypothetical protein
MGAPTTMKLYGEQTTLLRDWLTTEKHVMNIVPVGSGKTFLASIALPIFASDAKYHKGKDVIYSAPTREMIKTLIWEPLKESCRNLFGVPDKDINNSELTIRFSNGTYIRCKSAEQKENLRGINAGIWVADEAALYSEESLLEITNRLRPKVGSPDSEGRFIVISTPNGANALFTLYNNALKMPDKWIVHHMTYEQMRSGNKAFIEQQKQILSPLKFAKDYQCVWESVEDKFFMAWNRTMCVEEIKDVGGDLYSFHDFNSKRMCAVVARVKNPNMLNGTIEVIRSYAIPNCSTEGIAQAIREDFPERNIYAIIDATGAHNNRSTTSQFGITDKTLLEKYGFTVVTNMKSNPRIKDTDNASNAFIARGGLKVAASDTLLLEALDNYHYEDASRIKLVKYQEQQFAHMDALGDCIRYGINHLFPVTHNETPVPDYQTTTNIGNQMPGAKYRKQGIYGAGTPTIEELLNGEAMASQYSDSVAWD